MTTIAHSHRPWAIPAAKVILPSTVEPSVWLAVRELGLGGSDAASLMGESRWGDATPWHCWATKTGRYAKDLTGAMARGHALEPIVLDRFRAATGLTTRRAGLMRSNRNPIFQGSVDCLTSDGGIGEAKTTTSYVQRTWPEDGSCPPDYEWQAKHYLMVTGKPVVHIAAVVVDTWDLHLWDIERDETELDRLAEVEDHFWHTYVVPDVPPPFDYARYTAAEVRDRWRTDNGLQTEAADPEMVMRLLHERAAAKELEKTGKDTAAPIDLALKALIGPHSFLAVDGEVVLTYKASKDTTLIDYQAAHRDLVEQFQVDHDLEPYTSVKPGTRSIGVKAKPTADDLAQLRLRVAAQRPALPAIFEGISA